MEKRKINRLGLETLQEVHKVSLSIVNSFKTEEDLIIFINSLIEKESLINQGKFPQDCNFLFNQANKLHHMEPSPFEHCDIHERNKRWLPKILKYIKQYPDVGCVVGMFHLLGPYGLLNLLHHAGFQFEKMGKDDKFYHYSLKEMPRNRVSFTC